MAAPGCKGPSFPVWPCSCSPFSSSCYWCCKEPSSSIKRSLGTPLGFQWLRLCTSNAGYAGMTLVREAGYHIWHIMAGWERILVANNGNPNCSMEQEGSRWIRPPELWFSGLSSVHKDPQSSSFSTAQSDDFSQGWFSEDGSDNWDC